MGERVPGPLGSSWLNDDTIDEGTLCRWRSPVSGPTGVTPAKFNGSSAKDGGQELDQDRIDLLDRIEPPTEAERRATELGRQGARLDHFAQQFSGVRAVYNAYRDWQALTGDSASAVGDALERELTFAELLVNRLIVYDERLGRYRSNLREQPGFDAMWRDSWLRTRFAVAFDDEADYLEAVELVEISLDVIIPLLLALAGIRAGFRWRRMRRTARLAMMRLLRTRRNVPDRNIERTADVLDAPRVFRHTIRNAPAEVGVVRIQEEGRMRLSSGDRAQYGEGVYAWEQNHGASGYIDIRVPAGTAVERITVRGDRPYVMYRLVPAEGDSLPVEVVGTDFAEAELAPFRARGR